MTVLIFRPGIHNVQAVPGAQVFESLGGVTPYSLNYAANGYVTMGVPVTLDDLFAGDATVDVYFCPGSIVGNQGLFTQTNTGPNGYRIWQNAANAVFSVIDGGGVNRQVLRAGLAVGTWAYIRSRRNGGNIYLSLNAGAEATIGCVGFTPSARQVCMGICDNSLALLQFYPLTGLICYAQAWNTDKGILGAVPTSPFVIDANTVGRWIHSEGAGATLGDTSGNGNNGTIVGATWSATVPVGWSI